MTGALLICMIPNVMNTAITSSKAFVTDLQDAAYPLELRYWRQQHAECPEVLTGGEGMSQPCQGSSWECCSACDLATLPVWSAQQPPSAAPGSYQAPELHLTRPSRCDEQPQQCVTPQRLGHSVWAIVGACTCTQACFSTSTIVPIIVSSCTISAACVPCLGHGHSTLVHGIARSSCRTHRRAGMEHNTRCLYAGYATRSGAYSDVASTAATLVLVASGEGGALLGDSPDCEADTACSTFQCVAQPDDV